MAILGCFGGTTIFGNLYIRIPEPEQDFSWFNGQLFGFFQPLPVAHCSTGVWKFLGAIAFRSFFVEIFAAPENQQVD